MSCIDCPDLPESFARRPLWTRWVDAFKAMRLHFRRSTFFEKNCGRRRLPEAF